MADAESYRDMCVLLNERIKSLEDALTDCNTERLRLKADNRDHEYSFDLRWKADMRAIKRWQAATGRELTWPDHADLVVWLLEQLEARDAQLEVHRGALRWCLQSGAVLAVHHIDGQRVPRLVNFDDFDTVTPPPEFLAVIAQAVQP